jgi:hypothetical protein
MPYERNLYEKGPSRVLRVVTKDQNIKPNPRCTTRAQTRPISENPSQIRPSCLELEREQNLMRCPDVQMCPCRHHFIDSVARTKPPIEMRFSAVVRELAGPPNAKRMDSKECSQMPKE